MTALIVLACLVLILHGHIWLALGVVGLTGAVIFVHAVATAPLVPDDEVHKWQAPR